MKLLLDQNISRKLIHDLAEYFPGSQHVYLLDLHTASDEEIWQHARENGYAIVTQDSDFNERSIIYGYPPKVIWIRTGNISTEYVKELLIAHHADILLFAEDTSLGCLLLYS